MFRCRVARDLIESSRRSRGHSLENVIASIDQNVQRAAAGDMAAFEGLYRQYSRQVYNLCLRMLRTVPEAEDLTQDVFVRLFRKLKTFRGEASFSTWLHRLTVNEVLMYFRRRAVRPSGREVESETLAPVVIGTENPERMSVVDRIALDEALSQLPPGYRAVFMLHDVAGYEHHQIGEILGCRPGTSKSQLHKARMRLRSLLKKQKQSERKLSASRTQTLKLDIQQKMILQS